MGYAVGITSLLSVHADVRWFEVDRSDVTQAKDRALAAVGAETGKPPTTDSDAGCPE